MLYFQVDFDEKWTLIQETVKDYLNSGNVDKSTFKKRKK